MQMLLHKVLLLHSATNACMSSERHRAPGTPSACVATAGRSMHGGGGSSAGPLAGQLAQCAMLLARVQSLPFRAAFSSPPRHPWLARPATPRPAMLNTLKRALGLAREAPCAGCDPAVLAQCEAAEVRAAAPPPLGAAPLLPLCIRAAQSIQPCVAAALLPTRSRGL